MTMCNIHIHILSTQSVLLDILTVINTHYTPYVHILHYVHIRISIHSNMQRCSRLYINWIQFVSVSDQAYHRCVVREFDDDVGAVCSCTVMCVQGVQEWAKKAALRSTSAEGQRR